MEKEKNIAARGLGSEIHLSCPLFHAAPHDARTLFERDVDGRIKTITS